MSQGRNSVIRALSVAWMLLTVSTVDAQTIVAAQQNPPTVCRQPDNISANEALVRGGYVGPKGKVHFTFGIEPNAEAAQVDAFREAVKRWNDKSDVSWMVLEESPHGGSADIRFGKGSIDYRKKKDPEGNEELEEIFYCGKQDPNDSSVRYHPSNMAFADKQHKLAVKIYVHELGHVFGLNHPEDFGLMDERLPKGTLNCAKGARMTPPLRSSDARAAMRCVLAFHYWHRPPFNPPAAR